MREVFIKSINQSSLKRVIWISNIKESDEVINLKFLTYIFISSASDYTNTVLHLEEVEEVEEKFIDLTEIFEVRLPNLKTVKFLYEKQFLL